MKKHIGSTFLAMLIATALAHGQTITFEPDGHGHLADGSIAADDMAISNQFLHSGVLFSIDNDLDGLPDSGIYIPTLKEQGRIATIAFG
jgi:hypothetical protein